MRVVMMLRPCRSLLSQEQKKFTHRASAPCPMDNPRNPPVVAEGQTQLQVAFEEGRWG